ncbi:MAG: ABC-type transport auxiliary lipoprotein family protein [Pseudomonadota bacterium]
MTARSILVFLLGLLAAACGPLVELPGGGPAPALYTLSAVDVGTPGPKLERVRLQIEELSADAMLATDRIAVRVGATEVKYLAAARWSDQPRRLVRDRLQEALEGVAGLTPLSPDALEVPADYRLKLRLRAFNAVAREDGALTVRVEMSALLVSAVGAEIVASRRFAAEGRAASGKAAEVVRALDAAHGDALRGLVDWLVATLAPETAA